VRLGDAVLQLVNAVGAILRIVHAGELQHGLDVLAILRLRCFGVFVRAEVVVAVGHAEAALEKIGRVGRRVVEVGRDPEPQEAVREEVRGVERIDVGAELAAGDARQRSLAGQRVDGRKLAVERMQRFLLDRRLVHVRGVVVGDLAGFPVTGSIRLGKVADEIGEPPVGFYGQHREHAVV